MFYATKKVIFATLHVSCFKLFCPQIREGLLLTALELHAELVERGRAVRSLREFFDNANNFDKFTREDSVART